MGYIISGSLEIGGSFLRNGIIYKDKDGINSIKTEIRADFTILFNSEEVRLVWTLHFVNEWKSLSYLSLCK